jgi:dTDP-4-amino-4,6-dideoxygalactose transaminase
MNGNFTSEFESWLAKKNHAKYAVCVHSGTSALEAIAEYYVKNENLPNPPTILIPSLTYAATANAFIRAGWDVHFVDVDHHGIFDIKKIPDVSWQAVVLVGLYGASISHMGDINTWRQWTLNNKIVIEDAAQHWLAADCTRIGKAAAISFDPMKNLPAYGNGGAVVTNDGDVLHWVRSWRDNGKSTHNNTGTNSRMSEIDCAHMLVKARHIDTWQSRRAKIAGYWRERLKKTDIRCLIDPDNEHDHAYHKFVIDVNNRDILQQNLAIRKIETKIHYVQPLHEFGIFRGYPGPDILSCASALSRRVLTLPLYPELSDLEVEYVIDQVLDCA